MGFRFTADEMHTLTEAQKEAIVDVVISGILATGAPEEDDLSRFDDELGTLDWGLSDEAKVAKVQASYARVAAVKTPEEAVGLVRTAAGTLTDTAIREKTFALLARVMYSGGPMSDAQKSVLNAYALAFAIPLPRLAQIAEDVKKRP